MRARLDAVDNIDTFISIDYYYLQDFMSLRVARSNLLLRNNNNEEEGTRVIRVYRLSELMDPPLCPSNLNRSAFCSPVNR